MTESLLSLFHRDLDKLKEEVNLFSNEADLWRVRGEIPNTAGNLVLHIAGNLQHFFGRVLGNNGYVRDREMEFGAKNIPREELLRELDQAKIAVGGVLRNITSDELKSEYPIDVLGASWTTEKFIFHLLGHLNYHLGQVNYLRRMLK